MRHSPSAPPKDRLAYYSRPTDSGCREWAGSKNQQGYGKLRLHGRIWFAHRLTWVVHHGEVPKGMDVCHSCDNPSCVNLDHLWVGTRKDNMHDMARKKRNRQPRGEKHNKAKLSAGEVIAIYRSKESGPLLAEQYGVTRGTINSIRRGETWAHITGHGE